MKRTITTIMLIWACSMTFAQDIFISKNANITFFSSTVVEDIEAKSASGLSVINTKSMEVVFRVENNSFRFPKKLMEEHFNENYMESDKFPNSTFKGKIQGSFIPGKNGSYPVTITGTLSIHGVSKTYSVPAELNFTNGNIAAKATFKVKIADHGIKVPSLVFKNIAEFIQITIQALYLPKQ
ncbi:YceI family protein [Pedobacter sp. G11]|uniref:YceI family protein n=1 Tax=Pedobacter sp. G11 TaxID=2482728 RepID=UPI000F5DA894|nr:YceI family protein [Pedobacter sp. G11]AZI26373.1 YceI family protein [Pedobacter sp. G11]